MTTETMVVDKISTQTMSIDTNSLKTEDELARKRAIAFLKQIPENTGMLMTINKQMAYDLLSLNTKNRNESLNEIKKLANEMNNGLFRFNGDTIRYDVNFVQCDGQTRLKAFLKSSLEEIKLMFITGLEADVVTTIDKGRKRSAEHDYQIAGIKNANKLPGIVKLVWGYKNNNFIGRKSLNSSISLAFEKEHDEKLQIATTKGSHYYNRDPSKGTANILGACYFLFAEKSETQANMFFESLVSGVNLYEGSPILTLAKYLTREKLTLYKDSNENTIRGINHIIYAWNKFRENENLKTFRSIGGETFITIK